MTDPASEKSVADLGEDSLVGSILARYTGAPGFVLVGPGDDAAVLHLPGPVVASTDTLVEGRDFLREWSSGHDLGVKTAAQNFADVAAMGARPQALLVSLAAPGDLPAAFAEGLAAGLDDEARRAGASVVGGDVSNADAVVVTGTALGVLEHPPVLRSGARAGDVVALAGRTGPSAAGLALLERLGRGASPDLGTLGDDALRDLVVAHLAPRPPYAAGPVAAAQGAHAMIDTSDGLLRDARRVGEASGVVLDLDPASLVPGADLLAAAHWLEPGADADPGRLALTWVLTGGEDHALLATFGPLSALPGDFVPVGRVRPASDAEPPGVLVGGRPWTGSTGWHHWSPAEDDERPAVPPG